MVLVWLYRVRPHMFLVPSISGLEWAHAVGVRVWNRNQPNLSWRNQHRKPLMKPHRSFGVCVCVHLTFEDVRCWELGPGVSFQQSLMQPLLRLQWKGRICDIKATINSPPKMYSLDISHIVNDSHWDRVHSQNIIMGNMCKHLLHLFGYTLMWMSFKLFCCDSTIRLAMFLLFKLLAF